MSTLKLTAKTREVTKKKVKKLRDKNILPAVIYGHMVNPKNISIDYPQFEKIFNAAGESTLIDLDIDDQEPVKVIIQDYQLDHVNNKFIHVDFHQVRMDETLRANIELKFVGTAPAVKELNAILVTNIDSLEIECLPKDLVHEIEVDVSILKEFDDAIHISDIKIPGGITVLNAPQDVVVTVKEPRAEKEAAPEAGETSAAEPAEAGEAEAPAGEAKKE